MRSESGGEPNKFMRSHVCWLILIYLRRTASTSSPALSPHKVLPKVGENEDGNGPFLLKSTTLESFAHSSSRRRGANEVIFTRVWWIWLPLTGEPFFTLLRGTFFHTLTWHKDSGLHSNSIKGLVSRFPALLVWSFAKQHSRAFDLYHQDECRGTWIGVYFKILRLSKRNGFLISINMIPFLLLLSSSIQCPNFTAIL